MMVIGLTGGIGSGKTTVSDYLASKGYEIIDADKIAREMVSPGSEVLERIADAFGADILMADGSLDRKKLGGMVFSDRIKKTILDGIMHKRILEIISQRISMLNKAKTGAVSLNDSLAEPKSVIFIDAALLYETGLEGYTDSVWLVDADETIRISRIKERDGITEEEVKNRFGSQMPQKEKLARADTILINSGSKESLYKQVDDLLSILQKRQAGRE